MNHFRFLSVYNSPFVRPKIKWYFGKVAVGVPYSLPRKRFGFDFVDLGWKTKWDKDDFRFEWNPMISFVFWKWQVVSLFLIIWIHIGKLGFIMNSGPTRPNPRWKDYLNAELNSRLPTRHTMEIKNMLLIGMILS